MWRRVVAIAAPVFFALADRPGFAADVPLPVKAVASAGESYAWSGPYVGAHAGYAFGSDNYIIDPALATTAGLSELNLFGSRGFSGGALVGYNVPFAQRWLVGSEADGSWQDIETRFTSDQAIGIEVVAKQDWAASLRGRLGYFATPGTLIYGTGGWAWSAVNIAIDAAGAGTISSSAVVQGAQVGIGAETAVTPKLHVRLEYLQTFYGTAKFDPIIGANIGVDGIKPSVGLARMAAVYQFGHPAPATVASPQAPAASRWTGFYGGGSIGGAIGYGDVTFNGVGDMKGAAVAGPLPSLFAGVNYQFAPRWVVGAEAEIAPSVRSTELKLGWLAAVRGRLGYLLRQDTLVYGTAGWLGTQVDDLVYRNVVVVAGQNIDGAQFGGGVETALAGQWNLRVDYQYAVMRKVDLTFPLAPGLVSATAEPSGHSGRIALVRRFGT